MTTPRKPKPMQYPEATMVRMPAGTLERIDKASPNRNEFIRQAIANELMRCEMKKEMTK